MSTAAAPVTRQPWGRTQYLLVALVGFVIVAVCAYIVRNGTVGAAERDVFHAINDLPAWLNNGLWPFQQFGNLVIALVVGVVVALCLRQWWVAVAVVAAVVLVRAGNERWAFVATATTIGAVVVTLFVSLYPRVMVSSTDFADSLTVDGAASSHYALQVMSVVALIFVPLVLLYQGWTYYVFRHRLGGGTTEPSPLAVDAEPAP